MSRLLRRASGRFYLRHPWQLVLAIAGISLGVAVYVGVDVATDSARRAFEISSQTVRGRTTHRLLPIGGALPESVYTRLVTRRGIVRAAPVIEAELRVRGSGQRYTLLGVDPIKEPDVRGFVGFVPDASADVGRLMLEPGTVLLPREAADEDPEPQPQTTPDDPAEPRSRTEPDETLQPQLRPMSGRTLDVLVDGQAATVVVIGTVSGGSASGDARPPAVADIGTVQTLAGRVGFIDRIDLRLDSATARQLASDPPAGTTLVAAEQDRGDFGQLTRAFHTNLTALGLLALLVGMFLIYSTMSFAIVQRRKVFGTLLAVGLDRRQLLGMVMLEAVTLGMIATAAGVLLGHVLANGLIELVLRTIGDLYFSEQVAAAAPSPWIYARGAALGLGATLVAAAGPALDAARAAPVTAMRRAALERSTRERARRAAWLAIPAVGAAALAVGIDVRSLYLGFAALFFVLAAGALLTPAATAWLMKLIEPAAERGFGLPGLLAVRGVTASLSRTGVATAALAIAVATVIGVGLMISSFRSSLVDWLDATLTADLYVSIDGAAGAVDDAAIERLRMLSGVEGLTLAQFARLPTEHGPLGLRALAPGPEGWGLELVRGDVSDLNAALAQPAIAISEPFAYRRRLDVGDQIKLPTPEGPVSFGVAGIYRDYNTGGTSVLMSLAAYRGLFDDEGIGSIGIHVADDASIEDVQREVRAALPPGAGARLRSTAGLVELSLEVFDRTFRITEVLRLLAACIAFLGVLSALLSIQLEKGHELAVLKAVGMSSSQLGSLTLTQTTLLGVAAGLAAVPVGMALAALLVHVINRRSFGWSMDLVMTPSPIATGIGLAVGAALLAGIYPAVRVRRTRLAAALREE